MADALLEQFGGRGFETWLGDPKTTSALAGDFNERHPLATDIFRSLVGLAPRRMYRRQVWPLLEEPLRTEALNEAALLEGLYLDRDTVSQLAALVIQAPMGSRDLLDRLWITRAARTHPLDADFLNGVLRAMTVSDRDLRWTEWVRHKQAEIIQDLQWLERRWQTAPVLGPQDRLRAKWAMWTLTSTVGLLRDHATRALYRLGCSDPAALFDLALEALSINDPYVPERLLAACYGVAMSLWADPDGTLLRAALPSFANSLVAQMFVPGAPHATNLWC